MTEAAVSHFIRSLYEAKAARYKALGLKPGEGGRFAPNMEGYEAAVADVLKLLPMLAPNPPGKPERSQPQPS